MQAAALTPKQTRFVQEYLVDGNGSAAAVRAGYSPVSAKVAASRMMTKDNAVRRAVEAQQRADAARLRIRREDVLAGLLEAVDQARVQGDPAAMISGWKEIGRMQGYYAPDRVKAEVAVTGNVDMDRLTRLSDAELLKIIAAGQSAAT